MFPKELRQITEINGIDLSYNHYEADVKKLIDDINKKVKPQIGRRASLKLIIAVINVPTIILLGRGSFILFSKIFGVQF
jgi:hypothetical protein